MIFDDWQFLITMASSNTYQTYQALARKYRPQTFDDFAGQETSIQQLKQAILQKKIHHAYLYTGTRGIGKTSLARLFAKCINCEQGITVSPCNTCIRCQQITNGQSIDVIEIDDDNQATTSAEEPDAACFLQDIKWTMPRNGTDPIMPQVGDVVVGDARPPATHCFWTHKVGTNETSRGLP